MIAPWRSPIYGRSISIVEMPVFYTAVAQRRAWRGAQNGTGEDTTRRKGEYTRGN
jgi:hypothetical protein